MDSYFYELKASIDNLRKIQERDSIRRKRLVILREQREERKRQEELYYKEENLKLKNRIRELEKEVKRLNNEIEDNNRVKIVKKEKRDKPKKIASSKEYKLFRETILKRDNYKCQMCGSDFRLQVHHIKPKSKYPDLIMDRDNCITLCILCHSKTESFFN